MERKWYRLDTKEPVEDLLTELDSCVTLPHQMVHVGTDAQKIGKRIDFVTVTCFHDPEARKGGRVWYTRSRMDPRLALREKLFRETWLSLEWAMELVPTLIDPFKQIQVHIDANPEKNQFGEFKYESGAFVKQLAGMVMGQGFKYILKPDAWAASHVADQIVKNKHLPSPRRVRRRRKAKAA